MKFSEEITTIALNLFFIFQVFYIVFSVEFYGRPEENLFFLLILLVFQVIIFILTIIFIPITLHLSKILNRPSILIINVILFSGISYVAYILGSEYILQLLNFSILLFGVLVYLLLILAHNIYIAANNDKKKPLEFLYSELITILFAFMGAITIPTLMGTFGTDSNLPLLAVNIWFLGKMFIAIGSINTGKFYLSNLVKGTFPDIPLKEKY